MQEASQRFINRITYDICTAEDRLNGAIVASMGARNPPGSRLKPNDDLKSVIQKRLDEFLEKICSKMDKNELSQAYYDECFYEAIDNLEADSKEIDPGCLVSFGRFQKIINIWIKYHVVLAYSGVNEFQFATKLLSYAHIPVDNYVIKWLKQWFWKNDKKNSSYSKIRIITSWKWGMSLWSLVDAVLLTICC